MRVFLTSGNDCCLALRGGNNLRRGGGWEKQENKHPIIANVIQGWLALFYRNLRLLGEERKGGPRSGRCLVLGPCQPLRVH